MTFEPVRTIGGKRYLYYDSYSSKRFAELKAGSVIKRKGNPNSKFVIRKGLSKPYAIFIYWGSNK